MAVGRCVIDGWLLIEYACMFLPMNQNALVEAVSKSGVPPGRLRGLGIEPPVPAVAEGPPPRVVSFTPEAEIHWAIERRVTALDLEALARRAVHDGVLIDAGQAAGLADADALGDMLQDRDDLVRGQAAVEQRCAVALGEAPPAGAAAEQAAAVGAIAHQDGEVAGTAFTAVGAGGVEAAEAAQIVHGGPPWREAGKSSCSREPQQHINRRATVQR